LSDWSSGVCSSDLNASCVINVTFTPTAPFSRTATLAISDNSFGSAQQDVSLAGVGLAPVASLSATTVNFPNQHVGTASTPQAVTLSNTGNEAMTISSIVITDGSGKGSSLFTQTNNCPVSPATLAANASCTINVTFTPQNTGTQTATLTVSDNAFGSPR